MICSSHAGVRGILSVLYVIPGVPWAGGQTVYHNIYYFRPQISRRLRPYRFPAMQRRLWEYHGPTLSFRLSPTKIIPFISHRQYTLRSSILKSSFDTEVLSP